VSPADREFYEAAREMFATQGWENLLNEIRVAIDACRVENIKTADDFWQAKGELLILHKFLNYEDMVLNAEAQAEQDAEDAGTE
jgi:hypothetical protein